MEPKNNDTDFDDTIVAGDDDSGEADDEANADVDAKTMATIRSTMKTRTRKDDNDEGE